MSPGRGAASSFILPRSLPAATGLGCGKQVEARRVGGFGAGPSCPRRRTKEGGGGRRPKTKTAGETLPFFWGGGSAGVFCELEGPVAAGRPLVQMSPGRGAASSFMLPRSLPAATGLGCAKQVEARRVGGFGAGPPCPWRRNKGGGRSAAGGHSPERAWGPSAEPTDCRLRRNKKRGAAAGRHRRHRRKEYGSPAPNRLPPRVDTPCVGGSVPHVPTCTPSTISLHPRWSSAISSACM